MESLMIKASKSWDLANLAPLNLPFPATAISDNVEHLSAQNQNGTTTMNAWMALAFHQFITHLDKSFTLIKIGEGTYASEWHKGDETIIAYANKSGELNASIVKPGRSSMRYSAIPELGNKNDDFDTTSLLLTYLAVLNNAGFGDEIRALEQDWQTADEGKKVAILFKGSDLMQIAWDFFPLSIKNGAVDMITRGRVEGKAFAGEIIFGESTVLMPGEGKTAKGNTLADIMPEFAPFRATHSWTPEQEARIPSFPDDFLVPEEVKEMATWYAQTRGTRLPANAFMWRSYTGYGKSTGAEILACILGLPFYRLTCFSTMETNDFISTLIPSERENIVGELPTFEDMEMDPVYSYKVLTGKDKDDASSQECLQAYGRVVAARSGKGTFFRRVNSELIEALAIGGLCEISEASRIKDQGTLVGLNGFITDPGSMIRLIDGSYVKRHDDALVIFTDNIYATSRPLDPSTLRRMTAIFDVSEVKKPETLKRIEYNTQTNLKADVISMMFDLWEKIRNYMRDEQITEGDISPSDLENWVLKVSKKGPEVLIKACKETIVSKITTDYEEQDRIMSAIVNIEGEKILAAM